MIGHIEKLGAKLDSRRFGNAKILGRRKVPIDDARALARCVTEIAADPGLAARLVENGYGDYQEQFSREIVIDHLLDIYRTVIEAGRAAA